MKRTRQRPAQQQVETGRPNLFINRNFTLLWSGQTISVIGDYLFDTTLILWIASQIALHQSWAPLAVSGVLVAVAIPTLLVPPIAGVFVDRWDKRWTMIRMDVVRAILILSLLLISSIAPLPAIGKIGAIYTIVFLTSCCAQFFNPSQLALIGDLVEEPLRPRASGLSQVSASFAVIIGPPLATLLFFAVGVRWALIADALSFAVSLGTLLAIRNARAGATEAAKQSGRFFSEMLEGLRFFFGNRVLVTLLISTIIAMAGAGAINTLDYFFVTRNLHASPTVYGYVGAAFGAGILLGAVLSSGLVGKIGVARSLGLALTGLGLMLIAYSRTTSLAPALALLFVGGALQAMLNVAIGPLVLQVTRRDLVGRVVSIIQPAATLTSLLSISLAGYLASTILVHFHATLGPISFGPIDTIFTVAGLLAGFGGLYALFNLRDTMPATVSLDSTPSSEESAQAATATVGNAPSG